LIKKNIKQPNDTDGVDKDVFTVPINAAVAAAGKG